MKNEPMGTIALEEYLDEVFLVNNIYKVPIINSNSNVIFIFDIK